jgi:phage I-like protein
MSKPEHISALDAQTIPRAKGAPEWLRLFPKGQHRAIDGRGPWFYDDAGAVITSSLSGDGRIHIDLDHSSLPGRNAPDTRAYGYVEDIEEREDGLWAKIDWTEAGAALMADRAYWGVSPVFAHTKDGRMLRIVSVSLTNNPAIRELTALNSQKETRMEFLKKLAEMLGLSAEASEEDVMAALEKKLEGGKPDGEAEAALTALAEVRSALGAGENASATELVATATALKSAGDGSTETIAALTAKVTALEAGDKRRTSESWLAACVAEGRAIPAGKDELFVALHMENPDRAAELVQTLPKLSAVPTPKPRAGEKVAALTADQKAVADQLGLEHKTFLAQLNADQGFEEDA